jgi:hypothetical protein
MNQKFNALRERTPSLNTYSYLIMQHSVEQYSSNDLVTLVPEKPNKHEMSKNPFLTEI